MRGKTIQAWGGPYKGPSYITGEDWIPYQPPNDPTPPFAEYISGHSTFSWPRGRGPDRLHRPRQLRADGHHRGRQLPGRAPDRDPAGGAGQADHPASGRNFRYAAEQAGSRASTAGSTSRTATTTPAKPAPRVGKQAWAKALTYFNGTAT